MQTDNLYLSEGDFVRPESFRNMRRHLRVTSSISRMCISLIDLAHERIYRVCASDIRVDIPGRKTIRNARLSSPLFVEMLTVRGK